MKGSLFHTDGVNVPCIMRWPKGIKPQTLSDELIQNIDFVPTFFDLAGAKIPDKYIMDGRSLRPLFAGSKPNQWRNHLYFEIGAARAVCTKEWKYITVRYPQHQIDAIKNSTPQNLPRNMSYFGRMGIGTRGSSNPNFFAPDQLYNLKNDPQEKNNLAQNPKHRQKLTEMKTILTQYLKTFDRPFGEFIPGADAVPPGQIDKQLELIKKIKIQGKNVILPPEVKIEPAKPTSTKTSKKLLREQRRNARKK
jgi:arylsulfatase A-like enzyme